MTPRPIILVLIILAVHTAAAQSYNISTFAGGGPADGAPATSVAVDLCCGGNTVATDSSGNTYFIGQNRVFQLRPDGSIAVVAGTGVGGPLGDGGPATAALVQPASLAVDHSGNLYIGDKTCRIRKVSGGIITTVAGNGTCGNSGDGGPATSASINYYGALAADAAGSIYLTSAGAPLRKVAGGIISLLSTSGADGLAVDSSGSLYLAQADHHRVLKLSSAGLTQVAGVSDTPGFSGDGGPATAATLNRPTGVSLDSAGNLYISDQGNHRIRQVSGGIITTVAGNGVSGSSGDGGPALLAELASPSASSVDSSGNLYIADPGSYRIRKVSSGIISTVAGTGASSAVSGDNVPATAAQFLPYGVAVDAAGDVYIACADAVRKVSRGVITTVAVAPGAARGVAVDLAGNLYFADGYGIQEISGGVQTTLVPLQSLPGSSLLGSVAVDAAGVVYFTDDFGDSFGSNLWMFADGNVTKLAYFPNAGGVGSALAVTGAGAVYVTDPANHRIAKWFAGALTTAVSPADASSLAVDAAGSIYFTRGNTVQKFANGAVTTIAGDGTKGFSGDGGAAIAAQLNSPYGVAVDTQGSVYIADYGNQRVRQLTLTSLIAVNLLTSPPGLSVSVDGVTYATPHLVSWTAGESHSLSVPDPQPIDGRSRYLFSAWSDGLASTHTITVPSAAAVYTAAFTTQYLLSATVLPSGNGAITAEPPSLDGYYNKGATVRLTASASPGSGFVSWFGDLSGPTNPQTLVMTVPRDVTASFTPVPQPGASQPASGSGLSQAFTFQFSHPSGWQSLTVLDVLINSTLDVRGACYFAYLPPSKALQLVGDSGDRCAVDVVSATGNGNTFTLTVRVAFAAAFGGNQVIYLSATDTAQNHSGWQAFGVWQVPFTPAGKVTAAVVNPAQIAAPAGAPQTLVVTLTDTSGTGNFGGLTVLINNALDGRHACYLLFAANSVSLETDAGNGGMSAFMPLGFLAPTPASPTLENSQCKVTSAGSSVVRAGNTFTVTLNIAAKPAFAGSRVVYVSAWDGNFVSTGWQPLGTWMVQ